MTSFLEAFIDTISVHGIGVKDNAENIILSKEPLALADDVKNVLLTYFLHPFKSNEYFHLAHETNIALNEIYSYASEIFTDPESFQEQSINIAKHLYEQSSHPKIKAGELYVVYFTGCIIDGKTVDAIGLFKSETKDTFLKVYSNAGRFDVESQQGVSINKLDKGCLIFNTDKDNGYVVSVVDNTNKGIEAQYWIDDFLHVRQRHDDYYKTQAILSMCKSFVVKELPRQFDVSKADQADIINKTVDFFKGNDIFDMNTFTHKVIQQPEIINRFNKYQSNYQEANDIEATDRFAIDDAAVKKQARALKSVIKLDKNFHIYIHGNNHYIKRGYDEASGLYYYQLFFKEEL